MDFFKQVHFSPVMVLGLIGALIVFAAAIRLYRWIQKRRGGVPERIEREAAVREELPPTGTQALRAIGDKISRDMHQEFNDLKKAVVERAHERLIAALGVYDAEMLAIMESLDAAVGAFLRRYREAQEQLQGALGLDALIAPPTSPASSLPVTKEEDPAALSTTVPENPSTPAGEE